MILRRSRSLAWAVRGAAASLVVGLLAGGLVWLNAALSLPVHREHWLEEYRFLRGLIETRYPSLEWTIVEGRLDLHGLDRRTSMLLEKAESRKDAERILREFVRAFRDGHLLLRGPGQQAGFRGVPADVTLSASTTGARACSLLEYEDSDRADFGFDLEGVGQVSALGHDNPFRAGVLRVRGRPVALFRIPSFNPHDFGATCVSEWERFRGSLTGTCEERCQEDFRVAMIQRLLQALGERIQQAADSGAEMLVVDLSSNRGGYEAFRRAATTLLAGRELPSPEAAIAATGEAVENLKHELRSVERALALCSSESAARDRLKETYVRLDTAIAEASSPCDRSNVWTDWGALPRCANLVPFREGESSAVDEKQTSGFLALTTQRFERLDTRSMPRWQGSLAVLTDRHTGSAAQVLAGILKDYAGATILGQRTSGSGGGWMMSQLWWQLEHTGLKFCLPDHESYRRDGSSYRAGVMPDVPIDMDKDDDPSLQARRLVKALASLPIAALTEAR